MTVRMETLIVAFMCALGGAVMIGRASVATPKVVETTDTAEVTRRLLDEIARLKKTTKTTRTTGARVAEKFDPKTGALVGRVTKGPTTSTTATALEATRETHADESTAKTSSTTRTTEPAPRDPFLRAYASSTWTAPGLKLENVALRPVVALGVDVRLVDRLRLDVRYAPAALNAAGRDEIAAELRLTVFEWR